MLRLHILLRLVLGLCLILGGFGLRADPVQLLVSSQPLGLLLGEILPDDTAYEIKLLIAPGASLHHPSLRPSQRAALEDAHLVIWFGPRLEPGLARYLDAVPAARLVTIEELAPLVLIELAGSGQVDGHAWLSPDNAVFIVEALADQLQVRKFSADALEKNRSDFIRTLEIDAQLMKAQFASLGDKSFIAVHDAFAYLGTYFQLEQLGSLIDANDQPVGARTIWDLQRQIPPGTDICLLGDTRYSEEQGKQLGKITAFHRVSVDLIGSSYQPAKGAYLSYLNSVLDSVYNCLLSNTSDM
jgi:zinc transport system substrate-binding protein